VNILLLAPHPFYQERGSPVAVRMLLQVLSDRGDDVHALVFHEGDDIQLPGMALHRAPAPSFVSQVPPGFSWKKIICDISMLISTVRLCRRERFDIVYAVEESVFIALILKWFARIPYVYDMDSRLSEQLSEKSRVFALLKPLLRMFERVAIRNALSVVSVCDGLVDESELQHGQKLFLLRDVSLLSNNNHEARHTGRIEVRTDADLETACIFMYVGNLLPYQGIDLMLESFSLAAAQREDIRLVIIGGSEDDVHKYETRAGQLGIAAKTRFLGPRPISDLHQYLGEADILVSPRTKGTNTPMKLFSYLHSGTPCLLTDLRTHNQVASADIALLAGPTPDDFSHGMLTLADDKDYRRALGAAARQYIENNHSLTSFTATANEIFDWLNENLGVEDR